MYKKYFLIDAKNQNLGRIATQITSLLKFHHNSFFINSRFDSKIIIVNLSMIKINKDRIRNKFSYKHTGYPGGLKKVCLLNILKKNYILNYFKSVIRDMLPRENIFFRKYLKNLYLYFKSNHPHRFDNIHSLKVIK